MSGTPDYILDAMTPWELFAHLHPEQARAREAEAESPLTSARLARAALQGRRLHAAQGVHVG